MAFGIRLGLTAIGERLAKLGVTPQKPLQRACQRDPDAIGRWRRETYPAIARQAKTEGGEVFFWDESGFRADAVHGRTWGRTIVCLLPGAMRGVPFDRRVEALLADREDLTPIVQPMLMAWRQPREQIAAFDKAVRTLVKSSPTCRLLMSVPGIGVVSVLAYVSTILSPNSGGHRQGCKARHACLGAGSSIQPVHDP